MGKTVVSETSMVNVRNRFSLSKLKVFKISALAKIFQRHRHSYTWDMNPEWSVVTPLGWVTILGLVRGNCKDGACLGKVVISLSTYTGMPTAQRTGISLILKKRLDLLSFANRHLLSRYPHRL